jgi:hypothetical protein
MHSFFSPYFYILTFKLKETIDKSNLFTTKQEGIQEFMMNVYMLSGNYGNKRANIDLFYTAARSEYTDCTESAINN